MYWIQQGINLKDIDFKVSLHKYPCCDNIMCFDIETSSAYIDKKVKSFTGKTANEIDGKEKISICYVWQFSIDDNIYMGRTLEDFRSFLIELENYIDIEKIVYVHNLSFEFQFLQNILKFNKVFARQKRKVLFAQWESYTFRCSYLLTNMSLDSWATQKKLPVKKLVGKLDYSILRTPKTILTQDEIDYCVNDLLVMYEGLKQYKEQYGNIKDIPLTQTGEVRKEVIKRMGKEYKYRKKCISLIPKTLEDYKRLTDVFQGGYTHANYIYSGRVIENVYSYDISSSYPFAMVSEKYPMTSFFKCNYDVKYKYNDKYSYIIHFKCKNLYTKIYNSFLSKSKCIIANGSKVDNGRLIGAKEIEVKLTNIDFEIFEKCYNFTDFEVIDFRVSMNDYLNSTFVLYILELYNNKTKLKNVEGFEALYMKSKQYVNSLYGMCVTKDITDEIIYNDGIWDKELLNDNKFLDRIEHIKKNQRKVFSAFQFGVWVTAYARRNLWSAILELDSDVVYCDTDSVKFVGNHVDFFNKYNNNVILKERKIAKRLNIDEALFNPEDKFGESHRLGIYDYEGSYDKFKTLGAKKYIYEKDGLLKMTVSGVRKDAVSQLNSIDEFDDSFEFDIEHANKLISHYNDNQTNCIWNYGKYDEYRSTYKYGISLQPTTYKLGISLDYYLLMIENQRERTKIFE